MTTMAATRRLEPRRRSHVDLEVVLAIAVCAISPGGLILLARLSPSLA